MKKNIHPTYTLVTATCSCGNTLQVLSNQDRHIDTCSACHDAYTGKKKSSKITGRAERFKDKYGSRSSIASQTAKTA